MSLSTRLLDWFDREKRSLPWRGVRDPYRVWVSEVMLQQTTVQAVRPRYEAFLARFPDVASLARARPESVLAEWSGLGYYARARNLHRAAREVVRRHGGSLPEDPETLRSLPGFGDYIAAAVASLAFGRRVPAAEANVTRVLSRVFAIPGTAGTSAHRAAVLLRAESLLDRDRAGDVTAALMDLGQTICRPARPACPVCPLAALCVARRLGDPERYPERAPKPATSRVFVAAACAVRGGRALVVRRPGRLLQDLWRFPSAEGASPGEALRRLGRELATLGLRVDPRVPPVVTRHTMVHRRLAIRVYVAETSTNPKSKIQNPKSQVRWLTPRRLSGSAIPTLTRKIAAASGFLPGPDRRILSLGPDESRHDASDAGSRRRSRPRPRPDPAQGRDGLQPPVPPAPDRRPLRLQDDRRAPAVSGGDRGR